MLGWVRRRDVCQLSHSERYICDVWGSCVKGSVWMRCGRSVGKVCEGKWVDEVWEKCGGKMCEGKCVDEV